MSNNGKGEAWDVNEQQVVAQPIKIGGQTC